MIKTKAVIEIDLNDRIYTMECPNDAPLGEVHDAICMMKHVIVNRISEVHESEKKQCSQQCESKECHPVQDS